MLQVKWSDEKVWKNIPTFTTIAEAQASWEKSKKKFGLKHDAEFRFDAQQALDKLGGELRASTETLIRQLQNGLSDSERFSTIALLEEIFGIDEQTLLSSFVGEHLGPSIRVEQPVALKQSVGVQVVRALTSDIGE